MREYKKNYLSPLGKMVMQSDGKFLTALSFGDFFGEESELPIFDETSRWLDIYFRGEIPDFVPSYRICNSTPFRESVIQELLNIPYGKTVTYGEIAEIIAKSRGIRRMSAQAVGGAVGWNPICIIIPCHRVLGASFSLVGYSSGGIEKKIGLLKLEGHDVRMFKYKGKV